MFHVEKGRKQAENNQCFHHQRVDHILAEIIGMNFFVLYLIHFVCLFRFTVPGDCFSALPQNRRKRSVSTWSTSREMLRVSAYRVETGIFKIS